jgi:hypothetical protein
MYQPRTFRDDRWWFLGPGVRARRPFLTVRRVVVRRSQVDSTDTIAQHMQDCVTVTLTAIAGVKEVWMISCPPVNGCRAASS